MLNLLFSVRSFYVNWQGCICALYIYICPVSASGGRIFHGGICGVALQLHLSLTLAFGLRCLAAENPSMGWVVRYVTDMPWFYVHTHTYKPTNWNFT